MKLGLLLSGGKDSLLAGFLAVQAGHELVCLVSLDSENRDSYMFHTPSIRSVEKQAEVMNLPLILQGTKGIEGEELDDLEKALKKAKKEYGIEGVVSGAVESAYQSSRIQGICYTLALTCFNPLWQRDGKEILKTLIKEKFEVIISGIAGEGLDKSWLGRKIDNGFVSDIEKLNEKYGIHFAGEGGEFESLVLNCPLFKRKLKVTEQKIFGKENSLKMDVELK